MVQRGGCCLASDDGGDGLDASEAELLARARAGEVAAYEELVRRYQELAFRVAFVITGSAGDAEEAAQDAFVRAYRALDRFRPEAPFRPWLIEIVANAARTRRSWSLRRRSAPLELLGERAQTDLAVEPEASAIAAEERRELLAAVHRLRPNERRVLICRYFLQLSEAETAAALGCARGTVKSRSSRALERLRRELARPAVAVPAGETQSRRPDAAR